MVLFCSQCAKRGKEIVGYGLAKMQIWFLDVTQHIAEEQVHCKLYLTVEP
jgi:hypothetical protein